MSWKPLLKWPDVTPFIKLKSQSGLVLFVNLDIYLNLNQV